MEDGVLTYNYIKNTACLHYFACAGWSETMKADENLLVTIMVLRIGGIKYVDECLLR